MASSQSAQQCTNVYFGSWRAMRIPFIDIELAGGRKQASLAVVDGLRALLQCNIGNAGHSTFRRRRLPCFMTRLIAPCVRLPMPPSPNQIGAISSWSF